MNDYARIEKAMAFMVANAAQQPSLETVAAQVHLSAFHFQRLFCRYAGVSPKRFLQALTLERGKQLIASAQSLADTAQALGLSGGSRLYDHFVTLEAVTPGEFKRQGGGRGDCLRHSSHAVWRSVGGSDAKGYLPNGVSGRHARGRDAGSARR
ncbi:hypothetical protein HAALTHF_42100n [Vreelandella aquamarina]|nr:hypothetical protein HAALTHF_42100n [Halomonas axialensis]